MKVELIDYTRDALELLLYTKDTRLMGGNSIADIKAMPEREKLDHLDYMRNTIKSSWEFVDFTFHIKGVTRAFTHQLVRTRTGKYAQQSQRTVDVRDQEIVGPDNEIYTWTAQACKQAYADMIDGGVDVQDARGILPTNMTTEIIAKFDLRTLHQMALVRLCTRTQGEYQEVFRSMRNAVIDVYPWACDFIKAQCAWDGTCAFPHYTECPIQPMTIMASEQVKNTISEELEECGHVANPIAKNGKTM